MSCINQLLQKIANGLGYQTKKYRLTHIYVAAITETFLILQLNNQVTISMEE